MKRKFAATIGNFDGIHKGHISLIDKTLELSQKKDILKYKNNTFKGTLIEYSVKDVRNNNSGYLTFLC